MAVSLLKNLVLSGSPKVRRHKKGMYRIYFPHSDSPVYLVFDNNKLGK